MKTDRQIIDQLHEALRNLHVTCETARDNIFNWYIGDTFAGEARRKALEALKSSRDHSDAKPPADTPRPGHGICDRCGKMSDRLTGCDSPGDGKDVAGIAGVCLCPNCRSAGTEQSAFDAFTNPALADAWDAWAAGPLYGANNSTPKKP
jgi:hypothetical protein